MEDPRKTGLKNGLRQLNIEQLERVLSYKEEMVLDSFNYEDGKFCPLAVALELDKTIENPTHEKVYNKLIDLGYKIYNTRGIKGNFYTTNRKEDLIEAAKEVLEEKKNFTHPTEQDVENLILKEPDKFIEHYHQNKIPWWILSHVIEFAATILPVNKILPILIQCLNHEMPTVQEGALYGLQLHHCDQTMSAINVYIKTNPHKSLKEVAENIYYDMNEFRKENKLCQGQE